MGGLIRGFDMHVDIIPCFQGLQSVAALGLIVGIEVARRTGDVDNIESGIDADTLDEIDGGYDRPADTEFLLTTGPSIASMSSSVGYDSD